MDKVKSIKYKRSPLAQSGLEISVEVTVDWDDKQVLEILKKRTEKVSYPLKETEISSPILNLILPSEDILSDSEPEPVMIWPQSILLENFYMCIHRRDYYVRLLKQ